MGVAQDERNDRNRHKSKVMSPFDWLKKQGPPTASAKATTKKSSPKKASPKKPSPTKFKSAGVKPVTVSTLSPDITNIRPKPKPFGTIPKKGSPKVNTFTRKTPNRTPSFSSFWSVFK